MNNQIKYSSMMEYTEKLEQAMDIFVLHGTKVSSYKSLKVTFNNIRIVLNDIDDAINIKASLSSMPFMEMEAKRDNESAKKASSEMRFLKSDINVYIKKRILEFYRLMGVAKRQTYSVSSSLKGDDLRVTFDKQVEKFRSMADEALYGKNNMPFETDNLSRTIDNSRNLECIEHSKVENSINNENSVNELNTDELFNAINYLYKEMCFSDEIHLKSDISTEIIHIKATISPTVISVSSDNLKKLKSSSHLVADLESIQQLLEYKKMDFRHSKKFDIRSKFNEVQRDSINKRLRNIESLLKEALIEEKGNKRVFSDKIKLTEGQVRYAIDAINSYGELLRIESPDNSTNMITDTNSPLFVENEDLVKELNELSKEALKYEDCDVNKISYVEAVRATVIVDRISAIKKNILMNNDYFIKLERARTRGVIPSEYSDMKYKLNDISLMRRYGEITESTKDLIR